MGPTEHGRVKTHMNFNSSFHFVESLSFSKKYLFFHCIYDVTTTFIPRNNRGVMKKSL